MKRILIIVTNEGEYQGFEIKTGLWLSELVHFYHEMAQEEVEMVIASPKGGHVPIDPVSVSGMMLDRVTQQYYQNPEFMAKLEETVAMDTLVADDFDMIYYTGGHGVMFDFPNQAKLTALTRGIAAKGGIVAAVCHGVGALTTMPELIRGKKLTGYSNFEEHLVRRTKHVPFSLEDELKRNGAHYQKALVPFTPYIVEDGQLLTGQNPQSTTKLAQAAKTRLLIK